MIPHHMIKKSPVIKKLLEKTAITSPHSWVVQLIMLFMTLLLPKTGVSDMSVMTSADQCEKRANRSQSIAKILPGLNQTKHQKVKLEQQNVSHCTITSLRSEAREEYFGIFCWLRNKLRDFTLHSSRRASLSLISSILSATQMTTNFLCSARVEFDLICISSLSGNRCICYWFFGTSILRLTGSDATLTGCQPRDNLSNKLMYKLSTHTMLSASRNIQGELRFGEPNTNKSEQGRK